MTDLMEFFQRITSEEKLHTSCAVVATVTSCSSSSSSSSSSTATALLSLQHIERKRNTWPLLYYHSFEIFISFSLSIIYAALATQKKKKLQTPPPSAVVSETRSIKQQPHLNLHPFNLKEIHKNDNKIMRPRRRLF